MNLKDYIKIEANIAIIKVRITPKQPRNEFFSVLDDWTLKIRIAAIPENGKANKELISFLTKELSVKKEDIDIFAWAADQTKLIKIRF